MKAKEYLRQIKRLDAMIESDIDMIATLEAIATRTTPVLTADKVQTSGSQQRMEDVVCRIIDMQKKVTDEIDRLIDMRDEARTLIQTFCDSECITLLTKRYLGVLNASSGKTEFCTWEQIAVDMGMSYKWVSGGLHVRALEQVQIGLDENEKIFRK